MSYLKRHTRSPEALSGVTAIVTQAASAVASGISAVAEFGRNPYAPEVICRASQIAAIRSDPPMPVPPCRSTPLAFDDSLGLRKAMLPIRAYVYAEQRPWAYPVALAAAVGIPFVVGYLFGKKG